MSNKKTLITGGARSGKSEYALTLAESLESKSAMYFVATAEPLDEEMKLRIANHKKQRRKHWKTIEEPETIAEIITSLSDQNYVVLVDCLTLWTSNLLGNNENDFNDALTNLSTAVTLFSGSLIFVTNEVGMGIVPADAGTRLYRDRLGTVNRKVADACGDVLLMVSGIPLQVKGVS